jgi:HAD superfamily hydrolase (TIGR01509 family)
MDLSPFRLVIFDKDGTLIDFNAMWSGWVESLAARLEAVSGLTVAPALYQAYDYDAAARQAIAGGRLATAPMIGLFDLAHQVLLRQGLSSAAAAAIMKQAWFVPDPAATAQPLADLPRLFGALRERGLRLAVATSDDRAPTAATLASLQVDHLIDSLIAADDDVPLKPAPDMVWAACRATGVAPAQTIVVGDALPEMEMARAAGAGLAIGVTSGVSSREMLMASADLVLANISELLL